MTFPPQNSQPAVDRRFQIADIAYPFAIAVLLAGLSRVSFLWFHTLAELFAIVIGVSLYLIARHSHVLNRNDYLLFLAQGFFWAGALDTLHAMTYSGMGLVANNDPNPPTQLWICARALEATVLLIAPRYLDGGRRIKPWTFPALGAIAIACFAAVSTGTFPNAFSAATGLTPFKIGAEYAIIAILALAAWRLYRRRAQLNRMFFRMLLGVIALTIVSEFAFTLYVSVYGLSNLVGHIAKFWAFWLLLQVISRWMLAEPFRTLSRDTYSFDAIPMPVLLVDSHGVIQSCNASARLQHPEGGSGQHLHETWHPTDVAPDACEVCHALATGQSISTVLHDAQRGEWFGVRLHPIQSDDKAQGYIYFHSDITERKRAEERLAQAEKMELIGRMTGGLAHDFNNLMGMVLGGLGLLSKSLPTDDKVRRHFNIADQAARRAVEVTQSLLAVARKQPLAPRILNIRDAIATMMPLLRQSAGQAIEVRESWCDACADLECEQCILALVDPAGLNNAILNLVINARDAMPQGGRIDIATQVQEFAADAADLPAALAPGRYVVVGVADSGEGMTPEIAALAFEPFFTTKETGKGTGLGLATVYGFARQSGGTATIDSHPGAGTSICIYLPTAGKPGTRPAA